MKRNLKISAEAVLYSLAVLVVFALALPAQSAALEVPVQVRGRAEYGMVADKSAPQFPWNVSSGSINNSSRLMLDLRTGTDRYGRLYLKGVAAWKDPGATEFELEQGDYLWGATRPDSGYAVRLFVNQRRYFTGEMSEPVMDDDTIVRRRELPENHNFGGRFDRVWKGKLSCTALGSVLGRKWDEARKFYYLRTGFSSRFIQASAAYVYDAVDPDSLDNHALVKGEVAAIYKKLSLIVSYEQSGYGEQAFFLPAGKFDLDGFVGNNFSSVLSAAGAAFAELRLTDLSFRDLCDVTFVHRYRALGYDYVNPLGPRLRESVLRSSGLYWAAKDYALDGRVVYSKSAWSSFGIYKKERVEAGLRGFLKNGSKVLLRGAVLDTRGILPGENRDNFVHAALKRTGRKIESGFHLMAKDIDGLEFERRFAVEARFNWTTELSFYGRVIVNDQETSHDAVFCRLELRPADHVFATMAYGREFIGDDPFLLEDPDIGRTGDADAVYTIMVRGDF